MLSGHLFLASLATSEFRSQQTDFINGRHANTGAHLHVRIGELCRERDKECYDHVPHDAAPRAMEEMGVKTQSRALMAQVWTQEHSTCTTRREIISEIAQRSHLKVHRKARSSS